jgi:hypothetical protein
VLVEDKDLNWLLENYQHLFAKFGMYKQNVVEVYDEWKEGPEDSVLKYLWAILEKLLVEVYQHAASLQRKYHLLSVILEEMRNYKIKYDGEKANDIHEKYLFCKLKELEHQTNNPHTTVKVMAVKCCSYCGELHRKELTIEEALATKLLPHPRCTNEVGCNCFYTISHEKRYQILSSINHGLFFGT